MDESPNSNDFHAGQKIIIPLHADHPYAGYDGEILKVLGDSVLVQIYHFVHGKKPFDLDWGTSILVLSMSRIEPLPPEDEPFLKTMQTFINRWNRFLDDD